MTIHYKLREFRYPDVACGSYGVKLNTTKKVTEVTCKNCLSYLKRELTGRKKTQQRKRIGINAMEYS